MTVLATSPWVTLGPILVLNVFIFITCFLFRFVYRKRQRNQEIETRHASGILGRWIREYWFWMTDPCVQLFIRMGLTPNRLTMIGVVISLGCGLIFWQGFMAIAGWCMILAGTFDTFDGRVARATGKETRSGAYLDAVMDRVSEGFIFLGIIFYYGNHVGAWLALLCLIGAFMVSYTRAKGEGSGVAYTGGSMQRPERFVYLSTGSVFTPFMAWVLLKIFPDLGDFKTVQDILFCLPLGFVTLMCWVTTADRITHIMQQLDNPGRNV